MKNNAQEQSLLEHFSLPPKMTMLKSTNELVNFRLKFKFLQLRKMLIFFKPRLFQIRRVKLFICSQLMSKQLVQENYFYFEQRFDSND